LSVAEAIRNNDTGKEENPFYVMKSFKHIQNSIANASILIAKILPLENSTINIKYSSIPFFIATILLFKAFTAIIYSIEHMFTNIL
jgi:hypothetical protein